MEEGVVPSLKREDGGRLSCSSDGGVYTLLLSRRSGRARVVLAPVVVEAHLLPDASVPGGPASARSVYGRSGNPSDRSLGTASTSAYMWASRDDTSPPRGPFLPDPKFRTAAVVVVVVALSRPPLFCGNLPFPHSFVCFSYARRRCCLCVILVIHVFWLSDSGDTVSFFAFLLFVRPTRVRQNPLSRWRP